MHNLVISVVLLVLVVSDGLLRAVYFGVQLLNVFLQSYKSLGLVVASLVLDGSFLL